jgi:peptidoglycan/xylan/chitin deacetylase (PgdA/CDA1 family)
MKKNEIVLFIMLLSVLFISGCGAVAPKATETPLPNSTFTPRPPTATPTNTATPIPPTPTAIRTPPALPAMFQSSSLNPLDTPHTYIADTCQYLKMKWDPNNSAPGTVVMVIMYHSITDDAGTLKDNQIGQEFHQLTMQHAAELGFMTINVTQLADFMEKNAKIPQKSMLLLSDDRHQADFFKTHFVPLFKKYDWTSVTMAWISTPDTPEAYYEPLLKLIKQGYLDVQAHGVVHNIPINDYSSEDYIHNELFGSISFIKEHFGVTPIAYIWPGGGFTKRGAEVARDAGYRLGFTVNPRGPLMFNWVPLSDAKDPMRPSYAPEGPIGDPLLVLPRYWSTDADYRFKDVLAIGEAAAADAAANRDTELLYYDIMCKDTLGPISTP